MADRHEPDREAEIVAGQTERERREAEALRLNLGRRKAQARARELLKPVSARE